MSSSRIDNQPGLVASSGIRQLYADPSAAAAEAVDKVAAARVWLLKEKPFFGVLARALVVEPTLEVPALRLTEDDRLRVNPLVVLELGFPLLCARIAHVALHAALGAFVRRGAREAGRWNVAHDYAIAPLLRDAGLRAGAASPPDELPAGASAEDWYERVEDGTRPDDAWCDLSDPLPRGEAAPAGTFTHQDDGKGDEDPGESGSGNDDAGDGPSGANHASSLDEQKDDRNDDGEDEETQAGASPSAAVASMEARSRELQWKMRLGAALEEERASGGKTFGVAPAWLDAMVRATIEPPPDWTASLQRSVAMLARTDRSFLRPSRRMAALADESGAWPDVVAMPGRRVVPAGRLVAVIDTSASIDEATLARFLGSIAAVATSEGFDEVRLVQADAEVTSDETVFAAELLFQPVAIVGRGGTNFGPALRVLGAESRRLCEPFTVAYLTDLDGQFPRADEVRGIEVFWVTPHAPIRTPPFGNVFVMR